MSQLLCPLCEKDKSAQKWKDEEQEPEKKKKINQYMKGKERNQESRTKVGHVVASRRN